MRRRPVWRPWLPGGVGDRESSWPVSRPSCSTPSTRSICRLRHATCAPVPASTRTPSCANCSISATCRSRRSRDAANSPGVVGSSMSFRRRSPCPSGWSSSATRSIRCARSTRPTSARSVRWTARCCCLPLNSSCRPAGSRRSANASARAWPDSPNAWPPISLCLRRSRWARHVRTRRTRHGRSRSGTRRRSGPPTWPVRLASITSSRARSSCSMSRATSPRRRDSCGVKQTNGARS